MATSVSGAQGVSGGGSSGGASASGGGNDALQQAFQQAIGEASKTLEISTKGQAQLNALRARPN